MSSRFIDPDTSSCRPSFDASHVCYFSQEILNLVVANGVGFWNASLPIWLRDS
jgi:hypothetical protein